MGCTCQVHCAVRTVSFRSVRPGAPVVRRGPSKGAQPQHANSKLHGLDCMEVHANPSTRNHSYAHACMSDCVACHPSWVSISKLMRPMRVCRRSRHARDGTTQRSCDVCVLMGVECWLMCVVRRMFGAQVCSVVRWLFGCGLVGLSVVLIVLLLLSFLAMPGLGRFLL